MVEQQISQFCRRLMVLNDSAATLRLIQVIFCRKLGCDLITRLTDDSGRFNYHTAPLLCGQKQTKSAFTNVFLGLRAAELMVLHS